LVGIDGKDALQFLDGRNIDLIITDLHMPNMDGIGLIKEVRKMESYQRIPILFLTTESQAAKKMEAKEAGATGWIIKPFVPAKLIAAINKVLR
jgi:two-component system chemotaxis response regulator CheY